MCMDVSTSCVSCQGSNEEIKSTFYVPKMNIKKAVKMVCLDIMSRQAQIEKDIVSV